MFLKLYIVKKCTTVQTYSSSDYFTSFGQVCGQVVDSTVTLNIHCIQPMVGTKCGGDNVRMWGCVKA